MATLLEPPGTKQKKAFIQEFMDAVANSLVGLIDDVQILQEKVAVLEFEAAKGSLQDKTAKLLKPKDK